MDRSSSRMSLRGISHDHHRSHHRLEGATASPRVSLRPPLLLHRCDCRKGGLRALGRLAELCDVSCVMTVGHDRVVARWGGNFLPFCSFWEKLTFCCRESPAVYLQRGYACPPQRGLISTLSVQDCASGTLVVLLPLKQQLTYCVDWRYPFAVASRETIHA